MDLNEINLYVIDEQSLGSKYGIGTYLNQITDVAKQYNLNLTIIKLYCGIENVLIIDHLYYTEMQIPICNNGSFFCDFNIAKYSKSVVFILKKYINKNNIIFHLNSTSSPDLMFWLRKMFSCKILLTIHYTTLSINLFGDVELLNNIKSKKRLCLSPSEQEILRSVNLEELSINESDMNIFISNESKSKIDKSYNIVNKNFQIIHNCLKDEFVSIEQNLKKEIRCQFGINENTNIILYVGRIEELKGVKYLIEAFNELLTVISNCHLVIIGEGDFSSAMKLSYNRWSKISFLGFLNRTELNKIYSISDVGVVPSLYEEFGYTCVEMMMHRIPLVVSDVGGLSEIIVDGYNGLKIPVEKDIHGCSHVSSYLIYNKLKLIIENEELRDYLADNARSTFINKNGLSNYSQKMISLYIDINK